MARIDQCSPWWSAERYADRKPFLTARSAITSALRTWFDGQGFVEVETGILQVSPGNETHLHAPRTELADAPAAVRHVICEPLRNSPPRNSSPRAKRKSSNSPGYSVTASMATCICLNSPCWNGIGQCGL